MVDTTGPEISVHSSLGWFGKVRTRFRCGIFDGLELFGRGQLPVMNVVHDLLERSCLRPFPSGLIKVAPVEVYF